MKTLLRFLLVAACALPAIASDLQPLQVQDPWFRAPPPAGSGTTGGFARLYNPNAVPLTISGARSTVGRMELHESLLEQGVARMRPVPSLTVPPQGTLELKPGGLHLMLLEPKPLPRVGERLPVWFKTVEGGEVRAEFEVRASSASGGHEHHQHH